MNKKPCIVIGGGGHAKVLIEALAAAKIKVLGFTDNVSKTITIGNIKIPYLGSDEVLERYSPKKVYLVNGVGSVGRPRQRIEVYKKLKRAGYTFFTVIHPRAIIASGVELGEGVQVMAGVVLQTGVTVGENSILNTRSSIDHDCVIGAHAHVAPGAVLCGDVCVAEESHIGAGAVIIQGIKIGSQVLVRAQSLVTADIETKKRGLLKTGSAAL